MQAQMQTELFAMPEEIPLFDQIPIEELIIVKHEGHVYFDENENGIPDGYSDDVYGEDYEFCDTIDSEQCIHCDPLTNSDCE